MMQLSPNLLYHFFHLEPLTIIFKYPSLQQVFLVIQIILYMIGFVQQSNKLPPLNCRFSFIISPNCSLFCIEALLRYSISRGWKIHYQAYTGISIFPRCYKLRKGSENSIVIRQYELLRRYCSKFHRRQVRADSCDIFQQCNYMPLQGEVSRWQQKLSSQHFCVSSRDNLLC